MNIQLIISSQNCNKAQQTFIHIIAFGKKKRCPRAAAERNTLVETSGALGQIFDSAVHPICSIISFFFPLKTVFYFDKYYCCWCLLFFLLVSGKNICGDSNFYLFFLESHWEKEGVLVRGLSTVVEIHSSWKLARELSLQAKFVIFPCRLRKEYVWLCSCWRNAGKDREKKKRGKRNVCMIYGSPAAQSSTVLWPVAMKNQQQQGVNQRWIVRSIWALLCSSFL